MKKWMLLIALALPFMTSAKALNRISGYEDSYLLGSYTDSINKDEYISGGFEDADGLQNVEVKFQFSLAVPIVQINNSTSFMFSYTQKSLWQLGNSEISSPFRETNYKPQFFVMHQSNMLIFNSAEFGYMHESNGQTSSLSRSWDRIYGGLERLDGPVQYGVRAWYVFSDEENNEDINDFRKSVCSSSSLPLSPSQCAIYISISLILASGTTLLSLVIKSRPRNNF
jgi:phospholipase A1